MLPTIEVGLVMPYISQWPGVDACKVGYLDQLVLPNPLCLQAYRFEWGGLLRVKILNPPTLNWMNHLQSMVTEYLHGIKV